MGAAEEGLQDLDPLPHAHRKIGDTGVERHFQPVLALDLLDLAPGALDTSARSGRLGAEEKVLQHVNGSTSMKCWWTMPIPTRIASCGPRIVRSSPSTRICPLSA